MYRTVSGLERLLGLFRPAVTGRSLYQSSSCSSSCYHVTEENKPLQLCNNLQPVSWHASVDLSGSLSTTVPRIYVQYMCAKFKLKAQHQYIQRLHVSIIVYSNLSTGGMLINVYTFKCIYVHSLNQQTLCNVKGACGRWGWWLSRWLEPYSWSAIVFFIHLSLPTGSCER